MLVAAAHRLLLVLRLFLQPLGFAKTPITVNDFLASRFSVAKTEGISNFVGRVWVGIVDMGRAEFRDAFGKLA